jgi:hypothetical protein
MLPFRPIALATLVSAVSIFATIASPAQAPQAARTPVLVELFTSEGCSSCPPADALLAKLDKDQPIQGAEIIILGEHVDYWDQQGWHDRFSSHQYTERQNDYGERLHVENVYTPQMIVDGTEQFLGNDAAHAQKSIQQAAQKSKLSLSLSKPVVDGRKVSASISLTASPASQPRADLYAALVDPIDVTDVRKGENSGRRLQHAGVVRSLQRVGSLKNLAAGPVSFTLNAPADATPEQMRLVVFAQQGGPGAVLGAVSGPVSGASPATTTASLNR